MTVADLITASFRRVNVIQANETPAPEDMADGFIRFKMMLGSWRLQRNTIPFIQRTTFTISSTKGTATNPYTVGTGGDVSTPRPPQPNELVWKFQDTSVSPTMEYRLHSITDKEYQAIPQKNLTSPFPQQAYYNPTYSGSLGSLHLFPVATGSNLQGVLYAPASIQDPAATSTTLVVPDGYELALMDNLAVLMWPEWREGQPIDPMLFASAKSGKDWIKTANVRPVELITDLASVMYDINSDTNVAAP
jgi:hypothetical protein